MNASLPLVSVLIPLYNHERYVGSCLDSVYAQTYPNLEVLVLDDGSRDASLAAVSRWRDLNPGRFVRFEVNRQENKGVVRALNRLVNSACGEFIALLASDDLLFPESVALRVKALQARPDWLAVFSDAVAVDEDGRPVFDSAIHGLYGGCKAALLSEQWRTPEIILRWSAVGPGFLARRVAYNDSVGVGLYDEQFVVEDRDFYLRLLARGQLGFVDRVLAKYRLSQNSFVRGQFSMKSRVEVARSEWKNARLFGFPYNVILALLSLRHPEKRGAYSRVMSLFARMALKIMRVLYSGWVRWKLLV